MNNQFRFILMNSYYTFRSNNSEFTFLYYLVSKLVSPILQLLFYYYLQKYARGNQNIEQYLIGNILLLSLSSAIFSLGRIVSYERDYGTLKLIEITSSNKFLVYISRGLFYIMDSILVFFIGILFSIIFLNLRLNFNSVISLFLINLVANFSLMGFGILIGSIGLAMRNILMLVNSFYLIILTFSGANFPLHLFPNYIKFLVLFLPLNRSIEVAKEIITKGVFNYYLLIQEIGIGICFYICGFYLFRFFNKVSKKIGSYDMC